MGKPRRIDLGAIDQERTNTEDRTQPNRTEAQQFLTTPKGASVSYRVALGGLKGVNIVNPTTDDALIFDGTFWIATPQTGTGGGGGLTLPATLPISDFGTVATSTIEQDMGEASAHVLKMTLATPTTLKFTNIPSQHLEFEIQVEQDSSGGFALSLDTTSLSVENLPAVQQGANVRTILIGQTNGTTTSSATFDLFDTALKSAGAVGAGASWSVFPALQTVAMATFGFSNAGKYAFTNPSVSVQIVVDKNLQLIAPTSGSVVAQVGDAGRLEISDTVFNIILHTDAVFNLSKNNDTILNLNATGNVWDMLVNSPSGRFDFGFGASTDAWVMQRTVMQGKNLILGFGANDGGLLSLNDSAVTPGVNGDIQRNNLDVLVFSGGAVRNLTNIGGDSSDWADFPATATVVIADRDITGARLTITPSIIDLTLSTDGVFNLDKNNSTLLNINATGDVWDLKVETVGGRFDFSFGSSSDIWVMQQFVLTGNNLILREGLTFDFGSGSNALEFGMKRNDSTMTSFWANRLHFHDATVIIDEIDKTTVEVTAGGNLYIERYFGQDKAGNRRLYGQLQITKQDVTTLAVTGQWQWVGVVGSTLSPFMNYDVQGLQFGLGSGPASRVGFFGVAPTDQVTSVAKTTTAIHAALVAFGLIT